MVKLTASVFLWTGVILSFFIAEIFSNQSGLVPNRLRKLISENPNADFIFWNGNRMQIKKTKFEVYINRMDSI